MFGQHHDSAQDNQPAANAGIPSDGTLGMPVPGNDSITDSSSLSSDNSAADSSAVPQSFRQPAADADPAPAVSSDSGASEPATLSMPSPVSDTSSSRASTSAAPDDLMGIKQQALQQLKPLVGHLEQTPEEKFRTTMMMIQASDDSSLIGDAYEAAKAISDEKTQAQALLDVVNEINYFTSQNQNN